MKTSQQIDRGINKNTIIAITGNAGSGKSTIAKMIVKHGYSEIQFSSKLKDIVSIIFNWDRRSLSGESTNSRRWREDIDPLWSSRLDRYVDPRTILQQVGTDLFRNHLDPNIWIYSIEDEVLDSLPVVVSDLRFPNEAEYIKSLGGYVIRVVRDNYNRSNNNDLHESETHIDGIDADYFIDNNGSISDLYERVEEILNIIDDS